MDSSARRHDPTAAARPSRGSAQSGKFILGGFEAPHGLTGRLHEQPQHQEVAHGEERHGESEQVSPVQQVVVEPREEDVGEGRRHHDDNAPATQGTGVAPPDGQSRGCGRQEPQEVLRAQDLSDRHEPRDRAEAQPDEEVRVDAPRASPGPDPQQAEAHDQDQGGDVGDPLQPGDPPCRRSRRP